MGTKKVVTNLDEDHFTELNTVLSPARVRVALGVTHNLGDYNSVRIEFGYEDNVSEGQSLESLAEDLYGALERIVEAKLKEYNG